MTEWEDFVKFHRENTVKAMEQSAYVISLVPDAGQVDVKFAVELGLAIMLDKPIVAVVQPGVKLPERLRQIADAVIVTDLDTEDGRAQAAREISELMDRIP
jgi:nucleoside 2-deoxyribosyltransferase